MATGNTILADVRRPQLLIHAPPYRAAEHPHNVATTGFPQGGREREGRGEGRRLRPRPWQSHSSVSAISCWSHQSPWEGCLGCQLVAATLIFISQVVKQKRGLLPRRHPRLSARWALCLAVRCGTPGGTSDRANVQRLFSERSPWETRARYALEMTQWLLKRGPFYSLSRRLSGGSRD